MRWRSTLCAISVAACGDNLSRTPDGGVTGDTPPVDGANPCVHRGTYPLTLTNAAFPGTTHPSAVVYVPEKFDPTPPVDVVVYVHGAFNCATNALGGTSNACTPNGAARPAAGLAVQLEASQRNAVLVVPEVMFDSASADPGALDDAGVFEAFVAEALMTSPLAVAPADIGKVIVASHGSGYTAVAGIISVGGIPVDEVWLLDSLYGLASTFDAWAMADLAALAAPARRFVNLYTNGGGTLSNSHAMATRAATWVSATPTVLVDDRTAATPTDDQLRHGLVFKLVSGGTDSVPSTHVQQLLATSVLSPITCTVVP